EPALPAPAKSERRGRAERDADDVLEQRPIAVPADPGAWIVADQQRMHELLRSESGEAGGLLADRQQPVGYRVCPPEARIVEVVAPAEGVGEPLAFPAVEPEGREPDRVDRADE